MRYRLLATPLRVGLATGLLLGLITGLPVALLGGTALAGVVAGAVGAVVVGTLAALSSVRSLAVLADLPMDDRVAVMRSVHQGLSPTPRLAPAVVAYAGAQLRRTETWVNTPLGTRVFVVLGIVQLLGAGIDAADGDWWGVALRIPVVVAVAFGPTWARRSRERVAHAQAAARSLLGERG